MINQLRAELYKLKRNKTFWVLLFISLALSALLHYLIMIDWWYVSDSVFIDAGVGKLSALSAFTTPIFFNLFIGTLAAFFISMEFSQSSVIKNQVMSGSKRRDIYISKYVIFTLGAIVITVIAPLLTGIVEVILLGHGDILNGETLLFLTRAFGLYVLQLLGYTALVVLLAIWTGDSGKTIIFSIIFTIIMFVIELAPTIPVVSTIYQNSIFYQFSDVFRFTMESGDMVKSILIGLITTVIIMIIGIMVFRKKEIK